MRIAYLRYNGLLEIGHNLIDTGAMMDLRTNLFMAICNAGHKLGVFGYFKSMDFVKRNEKVFKGNFKYYKDQLPDYRDFDCLLIENGASNTNFSFNFKGENIPYIVFCNQILKKWKGIVFYFNLDTSLPFVFFPEFFSVQYVNNYLYRGNFVDILKDKKFVLLTCGKNQEEFLKANYTYRFPILDLYNSGAIFCDYFEGHFATINPEFYSDYKIFKIKENDKKIIYIGRQRSRIKKFKKYYGLFSQEFPVSLYGNWDVSFVKRDFPNIKYEGKLEKGLVYETYNKNLLSIVIGDEKYEKTKQVSGRFFEAIQSKSVVLIDYDLEDTIIKDILSRETMKEILLSKNDDYNLKLVRKIFNWDFSERKNFIETINQELNRFNMKDSVDMLVSLIKKYEKKKIDNLKVLKAARNVFSKMILERNEVNEFSKIYFNHILIRFYEKNADGKFNLFTDGKVKPVKFDSQSKCFLCGEIIERRSVFASRIKCEKCKNFGFSLKRLKYNLEKYIKKIS